MFRSTNSPEFLILHGTSVPYFRIQSKVFRYFSKIKRNSHLLDASIIKEMGFVMSRLMTPNEEAWNGTQTQRQ